MLTVVKNKKRMRDDLIEINLSPFMPICLAILKPQTRPSLQMILIKETIYSLDGSSHNSVNVNPVSITCLQICLAKSLEYVNHLIQTKKS